MNTRSHRAWRFFHPDLDAPESSAGVRLSSRGAIETAGGNETVRQAILLLLSTVPGERVMRPDYGCHLHRLVFAPNDPTTHGLAIHYVRRALERWEPRIDILKLDAGMGKDNRGKDDPNVLDIFLEYRVRATRRTRELSFSVDLTGEEA
ncbi:MAG: GPW/gp25 family protein [Dehalococcoidia bacterium]